MKSWRMALWLLIALGLAGGAAWSLLSMGDAEDKTMSAAPTPATRRSGPAEEIGEDSRQALRDLLRESAQSDRSK